MNEPSFMCEIRWGMSARPHHAPAVGFRVLSNSPSHIYACCEEHSIFEADDWLYIPREQAAMLAVRLLTLTNDLLLEMP